jgi:CubicO group peptidase (beta-lactamase class C family)
MRGVLFSVMAVLMGCGPSAEELQSVRITPHSGGEWEVSTPEDQGLDPALVARLFFEAQEMETLFGLLVVKNGQLIAEGYFNEGSIDQVSGRASATKSFTGALVGIALKQGRLESLDQRMMDFFPEYEEEIQDPRKRQITIRQLLEMRGGYPDEEYTADLFERMFFHGNWTFLAHLVDFPLASEPGSEFHFSNLTSHLLGVIVARTCGQDLGEFAHEFLFSLWVAKSPSQCGNGWPRVLETTTAEWRAGSCAQARSRRGGMWPFGGPHGTTVGVWGTRWFGSGGPNVEKGLLL